MPAERIIDSISLQALLAGIADAPPIAITGIATDSRDIVAGNAFLALQGERSHGMEFAPQAAAAGAAVVVHDGLAPVVAGDVPHLAIERLRDSLGEIANRWYRSPSHALSVAGVTGTNGKSTVALLLTQCLHLLNERCGYIGTLGHGIDDIAYDGGLTTPDCLQLHRTLANFVDDGATHAVAEVSSHALAQRRVDGVRIDAALFTNLSRDHIDYHGDMESYFAAKAKLFDGIDASRCVINVNDDAGRRLAAMVGAGATLVSTDPSSQVIDEPHVVASSIDVRRSELRIAIDSSWGSAILQPSLVGRFNAENALLVFADLLRRGVDFAAASEVMSLVRAPAGRMQFVGNDNDESLPTVLIDFAHTPAALGVALQTLAPVTAGRLWCVFGCGGDRDRGKRPQMGKVAAAAADVVVVTSDNPRGEAPIAIIDDIVAGAGDDCIVIEDRAAAIAHAVANSHADDVVLIAGKGHELTQTIGDTVSPFSDFETAAACLRQRSAANGGQS